MTSGLIIVNVSVPPGGTEWPLYVYHQDFTSDYLQDTGNSKPVVDLFFS